MIIVIYIYNSWNEEYERFKQDYMKLSNKNYDDLLNKYKKGY